MGGRVPLRSVDVDAALRRIVEGTATETGAAFFAALVQNLAQALEVFGAWVTEYDAEARKLRALAFWLNGHFLEHYETPIAGTPCEKVIDSAELVHVPDNVFALYPQDAEVEQLGAVSYMGLPLLDTEGSILGHLAIMDQRPLPEDAQVFAIFRIFGARAGAELRRLRAEAERREREEKLRSLVASAMDAVVEIDPALHISMVNPAAEKVFGYSADEMGGQDFTRFLTPESRQKLIALLNKIDACPVEERYLWIPNGLEALHAKGERFTAEATLSRYEAHRRTYHALILRNVSERLRAEAQIQSLTVEREYLRSELAALQRPVHLLGESPKMRHVLEDIAQVAKTDATVIIFGETGTGKELIARAIHESSHRRGKPLVRVNCAAIPAALMESEFFGHVKGAFTGATAERAGRFALADAGTIFLDEVGELSIDLQAKLLRVLQEGEFEPVGSSRTQHVDVRVLAATNRDLARAVREGTFREDLYYRLHVFPLEVPPLRDRGQDIILLAQTFTTHFSQRMGKKIAPLSAECERRLCAYSWPGNVRELENVIERAIITSVDGRLNLDRALPEAPFGNRQSGELPAVMTLAELQALERQNIANALEACNWRVSGERGAARLLRVHPSTLSSRIKALGICRPRKGTQHIG